MKTFYNRCALKVREETVEEFLEILSYDLSAVLKHDFLTKSKAAFYNQIKDSVDDGEYVVCFDIAEFFFLILKFDLQSMFFAFHAYVTYISKSKSRNFSKSTILEKNVF